jgi:hypothetical protein
MKEVSELWDGEGDTSSEGRVARLGADFVILVADRREGLEMGIDV